MIPKISPDIAYFVGPSSEVWIELGLAPSFPPMGVLQCNGHGPAVSCVKWS
jgi:hypothetical protein